MRLGFRVYILSIRPFLAECQGPLARLPTPRKCALSCGKLVERQITLPRLPSEVRASLMVSRFNIRSSPSLPVLLATCGSSSFSPRGTEYPRCCASPPRIEPRVLGCHSARPRCRLLDNSPLSLGSSRTLSPLRLAQMRKTARADVLEQSQRIVDTRHFAWLVTYSTTSRFARRSSFAALTRFAPRRSARDPRSAQLTCGPAGSFNGRLGIRRHVHFLSLRSTCHVHIVASLHVKKNGGARQVPPPTS